MILVEKHIIKSTNSFYKELDDLCFKSKNLYNSGLYLIRQNFINKISNNVSWININNQFVKEKQADYYALPSKVSQQTLKLVEQNMKSFFNALKVKNSKPRLPKYLDKIKGRLVVTYTNQAISKTELKNGLIKLSQSNVRIKTNVRDVQQVRVVPKNGFIVIEILYKKENIKPFIDNGRKCAVDLGLNNLMTCVFNDNTMKPIIVNGKPLKSLNAYFNKHKAKEQSKLFSNKNKLVLLSLKRENRINDYLHKSTRMFINYLVSNNITTLIVGYNKEWKQGINIGKVNNQKFVNIPYYKLLNMLEYKCLLQGISIVLHEESYTSKCSFLDGESIEKHNKYVGKRIKRGLFKSSKGMLINADVNGAFNIMRKVVGNINIDPILVCSTPLSFGIIN